MPPYLLAVQLIKRTVKYSCTMKKSCCDHGSLLQLILLKCCLKFNNLLVRIDITQDYKKNRLLEPANSSLVKIKTINRRKNESGFIEAAFLTTKISPYDQASQYSTESSIHNQPAMAQKNRLRI